MCANESRTRRTFIDSNTCGILPSMDIAKMLADLRQERDQVDEAIMVLERMALGRGKRRGRPPAWMTAVKRRGRPPGSKNKPKTSAD
jgi:hypothetical protein